MCDEGWEWWAGGRWITECDIISWVFCARLAEWDRNLIPEMRHVIICSPDHWCKWRHLYRSSWWSSDAAVLPLRRPGRRRCRRARTPVESVSRSASRTWSPSAGRRGLWRSSARQYDRARCCRGPRPSTAPSGWTGRYPSPPGYACTSTVQNNNNDSNTNT